MTRITFITIKNVNLNLYIQNVLALSSISSVTCFGSLRYTNYYSCRVFFFRFLSRLGADTFPFSLFFQHYMSIWTSVMCDHLQQHLFLFQARPGYTTFQWKTRQHGASTSTGTPQLTDFNEIRLSELTLFDCWLHGVYTWLFFHNENLL